MNKTIKGWCVVMKDIDDDEPAFVDFVSLNREKAEKYAKEMWDDGTYDIISCTITYET